MICDSEYLLKWNTYLYIYILCLVGIRPLQERSASGPNTLMFLSCFCLFVFLLFIVNTLFIFFVVLFLFRCLMLSVVFLYVFCHTDFCRAAHFLNVAISLFNNVIPSKAPCVLLTSHNSVAMIALLRLQNTLFALISNLIGIISIITVHCRCFYRTKYRRAL